MIHKGHLKVEGVLAHESEYKLGNKKQKLYGFRVFAGDKKETKLTEEVTKHKHELICWLFHNCIETIYENLLLCKQ